MNDLPDDMLFTIFMNADLSSLKRLCSSNRRFNELCLNDNLWKEKYYKTKGPSTLGHHKSWNTKFKKEFGVPYQRKDKYLVEIKSLTSSYYDPDTKIVFDVNNIDDIWSIIANVYNSGDRNNILYNKIRSVLDIYSGHSKNINADTVEQIYLHLANEKFVFDPTAIVHAKLIKISRIPFWK